MDKKDLTEQEIRTRYITPAICEAGWPPDLIRLLNEIERVLAPGETLFIADLRRSWLGWVEREIRSALTVAEARELIGQSELRPGVFSQDLLWWRYETEPSS